MSHHHPEHDPDSRLRLRLFIGGTMADEHWIDATDPKAGDLAEATSQLHAAACDEADRQGQLWLIEVYDPSAPPGAAYLRVGTDTEGMCDPLPLAQFPGVDSWLDGSMS
jgi:hypothetical protein